MNRRLLLLVSLLVLTSSLLTAQTFAPLGGYDFLRPSAGKTTGFTPKVNCGTFEPEDLILLRPGQADTLVIGLDTVGLGNELTYSCTGCATVASGTVTFSGDTLYVGADAGAGEELRTLTLVACNPAGACSPEISRPLLLQRAGRTTDLGSFDLPPAATLDLAVPAGELPAPIFCRTAESCAPDYLGREQRADFRFGLNESNEVRYVAARAAGTDRLCIEICTALGLCDAYTATITITRPRFSGEFFDDFSYGGTRPAFDLWQDEDVLVNRNFAQQPPSIGVATFDAIDSDGRPYPGNRGSNTTEFRDYLTSTPLNLTDSTGTVLNFYLQPRGLGNRPERQDSFLVQFREISGRWRTVLGVGGLLNTIGTNQPVPFEAYTLPVAPVFLYDGFQFRFVNQSNETGAVDMWHLDYVKLSRNATSLVNQDLALVETPEVLIEPYTSLPLRHYQALGPRLLRDSITLHLFNHRDDITPISRGRYVIRDADAVAITSGGLISTALFPGGTGVLNRAFDRRRTGFATWSGAAAVDAYLQALGAGETVKITQSYLLDVDTESVGFAPGITANSNVTTTTCFDEYFAYDDGSAELTLEVDDGGTILQAYDTYVNDKLIGVQLAIPQGLGPLGDQDLRLVVYTGAESPETLLYAEDFPLLQPEELFFDSLQGFTTYRFAEELIVPAGRLYVGWEQRPAARNVGVGFDRNSTPDGVQWFNVGNGFQPLRGTTTGAIMLRPLMGGFTGFQTSTDEAVAAVRRLEVFPSPTPGTLHLRPRPDQAATLSLERMHYRIFALSGAVLQSGPAQSRLDLAALPAGVYWLELRSNGHREHHRIIRQ